MQSKYFLGEIVPGFDSGPTNGQNKRMAKLKTFPKWRMAMAIH